MKKRILVEVGIKASRHILGAKLEKPCLRERESPTATPCPAKRDLTHKATPASCCCLNTEGKGPGSAQGQQLPSCETMGILTPRAGRGGSTALPCCWASRHPKHDVAGKPCPAWRWQGAGSCSSSPHTPAAQPTCPAPRRRHSQDGAISSFTTLLTYFFRALLQVGAGKGRSTVGGSDN